eukprot:SAG11_NODE_698_length_7682_cov_6.090993_2_plen_75_part_00
MPVHVVFMVRCLQEACNRQEGAPRLTSNLERHQDGKLCQVSTSRSHIEPPQYEGGAAQEEEKLEHQCRIFPHTN